MIDTKDQSNAIVPIEYGILFVNTVDTKMKACNALNAMIVETVDATVKTHPHIPAHSFFKHSTVIFNPQKVLERWDSGLFNHTIHTIYVDTVKTVTLISNAFNAIFVDTVDEKTHPNIPAHNFLNIQRIFNPGIEFWKAEAQGLLQPYHQYYRCRHCQFMTRISTGFQCYLCWHCWYKTHPDIPAQNLTWSPTDCQCTKSFGKLSIQGNQWPSILYTCRHCRYIFQGCLMHSMLSSLTLLLQNTSTHS